jgi:hypothetical protein
MSDINGNPLFLNLLDKSYYNQNFCDIHELLLFFAGINDFSTVGNRQFGIQRPLGAYRSLQRIVVGRHVAGARGG